MKEVLANAKFVDKDTIFVEGVTDKEYLELAISVYSKMLSKKMQEGTLQIVTREENGCGTRLLVDWAIAWMHLNYSSKAVVLLDSDKEGKRAQRDINEVKQNVKKNHALKAILLQPTEDVKKVNQKIGNAIDFTIEHLLSYEFWQQIQMKNWVEERKDNELFSVFGNVINKEKSLSCIIEEVINNKALQDTVIYYIPKNEKKSQILNLVRSEVEAGNSSVLEGFRNTISKLEKEFK